LLFGGVFGDDIFQSLYNELAHDTSCGVLRDLWLGVASQKQWEQNEDSDFHSSIRSPCTQFISQNGDALIHLLIDRVPPHVACVKLHICKNAFVEVPKDSTLCPMCNIFVGMAEQFLNSNHTIDQIEQILHNFPCQFIFDGEMEKQCEKFIDSYVPQLIEWIVKNESPVIFCTQIGLCP